MTGLFARHDGPRVFGLPPGVDFSRALLEGLDARLAGQPPEAAARVEIWVNTQRARRALLDLMNRGPSRLVPRVRVVTDLASDPLAPLTLSAAVPDLRRKLELSRMVAALLATEPGMAAETAAFDLADSLAELLDEMQGEGIDPAVLESVDPGDHAEHWRRSLAFLTILRDYAVSTGMSGGQGRMRAVAEAWGEAWAVHPPAHPVIVAGSTGSRGPTRAFMAAVAKLPQGALVLPGFDAGLNAEVWARLGAGEAGAGDHPQHGFRLLADALGFDPTAVMPWTDARAPSPERNALVSLAMRPAPVTGQWRAEGGALRPGLAAACSGLTWIEAPDPRSEALAIALALRQTAETGGRAALISPDRMLTRRVTAELDRWGIRPDDSAGRPLALTPPGVLLRRLAALPGSALTPEELLVLLKHPLTASGPGRRDHLDLTTRLEMKVLRGGAPHVRWEALRGWAGDVGEHAARWVAWLEAALAPMLDGAPAPLAEMIARHVAAAEMLAGGPEGGPHGLWEREAGGQALALMETLTAEADAGGTLRPSEYRALLQTLMAAREVPEEAVVTDPGIAIWGTLEARVQSADLVILGGMNETVWPRLPAADPWLSRTLRAQVGLPSPERRIGLSAHDFQQAMGAERVILTRALRDAEAPTVASRWLMRLENLLRGLGPEGQAALEASRDRGAAWLAMAPLVDLPDTPVTPASRPEPRPPVEARPDGLSVTQIETLVRDPYAIYARKVLGLRPLEPVGRKSDAMARGSAIHSALETFVRENMGALPEDAETAYFSALRSALHEAAPSSAVRAWWTARLGRASEWFLEGERERRLRGRPVALEVKGERPLTGLHRTFKVTAKADRIDVAADGRYGFYDYKSGNVPSEKEVKAFHLQLPLEAAIAEAGGFDGLPAASAFRLELIGLGAQATRRIDADPQAVAVTWARLHKLIGYYLDPANGFTARLRPQKISFESEYDHLSRKGEWSDGEPPEGSP